MAKTATATLPEIPSLAVRHGREQGRGGARYRSASIEERTAVLETRWEQTVPTLATSKDISDLRGELSEMRGEMRNLENRLLKWGIGAGLAAVGVFAAVHLANSTRMDRLDEKIDSLAARQDARMDRLDEKFDSLAARQDARMDRLDEKIDRIDAKMDARFDALMNELREMRTR